MAIVFPASPTLNDTFTAGFITYKCVQVNPNKWIGLGVTPADRLVEGSNSLEINASNNLVWTGGDAKFGGSLEVGANIDLTDSTVDLYSQTTNAASKTFQLFSDIGGTKTEKLSITANGAITLADQIKIEGGSTPTGLSSRISKYGSLLIGTSSDAVGDARCSIDSGNGNIISVGTITTGSTFSVANVSGSIAGSGGGQDYIGLRHGTTFGLILKTAGTNVGNVGINNTHPARQLSVYDASNSGVEIKSNTDGQSSVFFTDTADGNIGMIGYTHNNDEMFFRVNDQTRVNITSDGYVTKPNTPYFSVQGSPSISNFTNYTNSVYNFATINSNNGSHYNNSTGRFTAPVAGFYWFSCGIWSNNSDDSGGSYLLNLLRDNIGGGTATELQFAGANHAVEKNQLTVSAGIYMTVGQTVRLWYNGSIQGSTPRNYFSGYLVG